DGVGVQVIEQIFDPQKGTITLKSSGCSNPHCVAAAPATVSLNVKAGETVFTTDGPQMNAVLASMLQSFQENPQRQVDLCKRADAILKEEKAIREKLPTAKPGEKKRLGKELEKKAAEYAKLKDLMLRTAGTSGWLGVPPVEVFVLMTRAKQKDPNRFEALACQVCAVLDEYAAIGEKLEYASNQKRKKQLSELLLCKSLEYDEVMNDIAAIADSDEPVNNETNEELNDVSIRINKSWILVLVSAFVLALSIAYHHLS
ncbi:hypothetical protein AAVH_31711, partial [Aphelenchoides avenae]